MKRKSGPRGEVAIPPDATVDRFLSVKGRKLQKRVDWKSVLDDEYKHHAIVRVGPKGQVVIPKAVQDALKIGPGKDVTFSLEGGELVLRPARADSVDILESTARSGKSVKRVRPHRAYESELRKRGA